MDQQQLLSTDETKQVVDVDFAFETKGKASIYSATFLPKYI